MCNLVDRTQSEFFCLSINKSLGFSEAAVAANLFGACVETLTKGLDFCRPSEQSQDERKNKFHITLHNMCFETTPFFLKPLLSRDVMPNKKEIIKSYVVASDVSGTSTPTERQKTSRGKES